MKNVIGEKKSRFRVNLLVAPLGLIGLIIFFSLMSQYFFTLDNIFNITKQGSINIIIAAGMTVVILSGGIDLSVGSLLGLCACAMAQIHFVWGINIWIAVVLAIILGIILGMINGVIITYGKIPPFIATLGMLGMARGMALIITRGYPSKGFNEDFQWIGKSDVFGVPFIFIIALILLASIALLLKYTELGRNFYALGGNEEAARYSGIKVGFVKPAAYTIVGLCCGIAAVVMASRINSAPPAAGQGYELNAIAAVVIGGTPLSGGEGTIFGTLLGALIMAVLVNGLSILNVDPFVQTALIGAVIIITVFVMNLGDKKVNNI